MKDITTKINESLFSDLKNKCKSILNKLLNSSDYKEWKENNKFMNKFIERNDVHDYLDKNFDFDNKDSFIELFEYGIALYLPFYSKINNQSIKSIKQFIKDDKNWELFKSDDNFAWYIPGVRNLLMVDLEDMYKYENDLITLYKDTHDIK